MSPAADVSRTDKPAFGAGALALARIPRLLLVEDDAAVRAVTESLLVELGGKVVCECDGPSALKHLERDEGFVYE